GRYLAALSQEWKIAVWDVPAARLLHVLDAPRGQFADNASLTFDATGAHLACAADFQAKIWETASGRLADDPWEVPPGLHNSLVFDPAGSRLLLARRETRDFASPTSSSDYQQHPRVCRVRDLLSARPLEPMTVIDDFNEFVKKVRLTPDGSTAVVLGLR